MELVHRHCRRYKRVLYGVLGIASLTVLATWLLKRRCHDGATEDGFVVADYLGDNFTLYTRSNNEKKCPPIPLIVLPHANIFECKWYNRPPVPCSYRLRAKLSCTNSSADISYEWVDLDAPPSAYAFEDECLARVIADRCTEKDLIPRVAHYVHFGRKEFLFHNLLSVFAALKFVQPCLVIFHADNLPFGSHWVALLQLVPHVIHVSRAAPTYIFGNVVKVVHHKSDVARLEAIKKFGGVYVDMDHIVLNPLDDLLTHDVVMGTEEGDSIFGNGFYLGKPETKFLQLWYDSYRTFDDTDWGFHSLIMPATIRKENPELRVHVVDSFFRPNWCEATKLFYENKYDWRDLYGVHLYHNRNKKFFMGRLDTMESSLGEVTRYILFGKSDVCMSGNSTVDAPVRMDVEKTR